MESLLNINETAQKLKWHPETVRRFIRDGQLSAVKMGKSWRVRESDLSAFITPRVRPAHSNGASRPKPKGDQAARAAAILSGLDSDEPRARNAAIMALSQADAQTSALVETEVARSVAEYSGPEDDWSDWRALDGESFHFPEEQAKA